MCLSKRLHCTTQPALKKENILNQGRVWMSCSVYIFVNVYMKSVFFYFKNNHIFWTFCIYVSFKIYRSSQTGSQIQGAARKPFKMLRKGIRWSWRLINPNKRIPLPTDSTRKHWNIHRFTRNQSFQRKKRLLLGLNFTRLTRSHTLGSWHRESGELMAACVKLKVVLHSGGQSKLNLSCIIRNMRL